jgi:glycosyltransferase involved in cell wall biosynthesis
MSEIAAPDEFFEVMVHGREGAKLVPRHPNWRTLRVSGLAQSPVANILWHQLVLPFFSRERRYDVLFLPAANRRVPHRFAMKVAGAGPMVGTVHDLAIFHLPTKYGWMRDAYARHGLPPLIRGLDHVLTVSEHSRRDVMEFCRVPASHVSTTLLATEPGSFAPMDPSGAREDVFAQLGISSPYILYTSRLEHPAKNHVRLMRVFARLKKRTGCPHRLVLAGSRWPGDEAIFAEANHLGNEAVLLAGRVPESLLPALICGADMVVFPSLFEGFGLPVLEAMACGVPVACSRAASLPEIAGDAACFFDPTNDEDIERAMAQLLFDPAARDDYRLRGLQRAASFDWRRTARQTLDVLREQAARVRRHRSAA